jgi:hypothetical protein
VRIALAHKLLIRLNAKASEVRQRKRPVSTARSRQMKPRGLDCGKAETRSISRGARVVFFIKPLDELRQSLSEG